MIPHRIGNFAPIRGDYAPTLRNPAADVASLAGKGKKAETGSRRRDVARDGGNVGLSLPRVADYPVSTWIPAEGA
jgi:hypothetical protein